MPMYAFDTLKTAKALAEAGFNVKQAEAVAVALRDAVTENTATKSDIEGIRSDIEGIRSDIEGVGRRFETVDDRFDGMDKRLDKVDARLDKVDARLDKVDARLNGMDRRLDKMDARLDVMDARLKGMVTKADMYRALSMMFGATILANGTIAGLGFAVAGYITGP